VRRRRIAAILGALMLALPATALATSLDSSSTSKFVAASLQPVRAALAKQGLEHAATKALISHVQSACPGAVPANLATGSEAERRTWGAFSAEALGEFSLALIAPIRPAGQRAIRQIAPLRWTSAALNRQVAAFVRSGRALLALRPPDICAQAQAAAANGFLGRATGDRGVHPAVSRGGAGIGSDGGCPCRQDEAVGRYSGACRHRAVCSTRGPAHARPQSLCLPGARQIRRRAVLTVTAGTRAAAR